MDIGNAKLAFGLSIKLFDDILKGLYDKNVFPNRLFFDQEIELLEGLPATVHVTATLDRPTFGMHTAPGSGTPFTRLDLSGVVSAQITIAGQTSPELFQIPLNAKVGLDLVLKPRSGKAPLIGLAYSGVKSVQAPLQAKYVDDLFATPQVAAILDNLQLDVLTPIIETLEDVYFFGTSAGQKPARDAYPILLALMKARPQYAAAIGLLIDIPPSTINVTTVPSFVPRSAEFLAHIGPAMTDLMVQRGADEVRAWLRKKSKDLKVTDIGLTLENNRVDVHGTVEHKPTGAEGHLSGAFTFRHGPGSPVMYLVGSDIDIDIDLPWWVTLVSILVPPVGFLIYSAENLVENDVPDIAQKRIAAMINNLLSNLASAVNFDGLSIEGLPIEVYPDRIELDDNAVTAEIQILAYPLIEGLKRADYSKLFRRFVMFHLATGRRYMTEDLAEFMAKGLVIVPEYHEVGGQYIRANPDNIEANNLLKRFGR
jgi:hypothetical protein